MVSERNLNLVIPYCMCLRVGFFPPIYLYDNNSERLYFIRTDF